jgi:hypothetical protein
MVASKGVAVVGIAATLLAGTAFAQTKQKSKKSSGAPAATAEKALTSAAPATPWLAPRIGAAFPLSPNGPAAFRAEVDAGLLKLPADLQLGALVAFSQTGRSGAPTPASTTGLEAAAALGYWYSFGSVPLSIHGQLAAGYAHQRTISGVAFTGYSLTTDNAFMARLSGALAWRLGQTVLAWIEPVNVGLYAGRAVRWEYSPLIGVGICM